MEIKNEYYLPVEIVFNLLCACKKGYGNNPKKLRAYLHPNYLWSPILPQHLPIPRVSFWIGLCESALLMDESKHHWPTFFAEDWLSWSLDKQIKHLVKAWVKSSKTESGKEIRTKAIQKITKNIKLEKSEEREVKVLRIFNLLENQKFVTLNNPFFQRKQNIEWVIDNPQPWKYNEGNLLVPYPPKWLSLWELESYLDRQKAGVYTLNNISLQKSITNGGLRHSPTILEILKNGLGSPVPENIVKILSGFIHVRLLKGCILEFETRNDLKDFRSSSKIYDELNHLISPRHIFLNPNQTKRVLPSLYQKNLLSDLTLAKLQPLTNNQIPNNQINFSISQKIVMLTILYFVNNLGYFSDESTNLIELISEGLSIDQNLRAKYKAWSLLKTSKSVILHENIVPEVEAHQEHLCDFLENAISICETIEIIYKSPDKNSSETRSITPLLIEERNNIKYLIAYCHNRKANRTFRLDRLKLT